MWDLLFAFVLFNYFVIAKNNWNTKSPLKIIQFDFLGPIIQTEKKTKTKFEFEIALEAFLLLTKLGNSSPFERE